jgi:hypothetical protein
MLGKAENREQRVICCLCGGVGERGGKIVLVLQFIGVTPEHG